MGTEDVTVAAVDFTGHPTVADASVDVNVDVSAHVDVDAADVVAELYRRDVSTQTFGIALVDAGPGRAVVSMVVRPDMCNGYDVCHGGMTFTLADTAMAFASGSHNQTALAATASIDFLSPIPSGSTLRATAEERWLKGRTGLYDVRVELEDGTLVAMFHGRTVRAGGAVIVPDVDDDLDTRGGA